MEQDMLVPTTRTAPTARPLVAIRGPGEIEVPRDREAAFEPKTVPKD